MIAYFFFCKIEKKYILNFQLPQAIELKTQQRNRTTTEKNNKKKTCFSEVHTY